MEKPKFTNETIIEIIETLVGEIRPVGETNTDNKRFENLKQLSEVVNHFITTIDSVGYDFKDSYEMSVKKASDFAKRFLSETIGIQ